MERIAEIGMKTFQNSSKLVGKEALINYIIVEYGVRIPEVAWNIQEKVKNSVENMTGLTVTEVNIHVQGINMAKETKKEMADINVQEEKREEVEEK